MRIPNGRYSCTTLVGLVLALLGVLVLPGIAPAARADFAGHDGRLVFQRNGDLYTVLPNGTGLHRLTTAGGSTPRWSADGKRIVFVRAKAIWVMSADGTNQRKVAAGWGPAFSPDGRSIAFVHPVQRSTCPPDGGGQGSAVIQQITVMPLAHPGAARSLYSEVTCRDAYFVTWVTSGIRWSPDGKRLLFNDHYSSAHFVASSLTELTIATKKTRYVKDFHCEDESGGGGTTDCPYPGFDWTLNMQPDYSPDGNAVVFVSDIHQAEDLQIWAVARTGKLLTYVGGDANAAGPVWSPDGQRWAYVQRAPGGPSVIKITPAALTPQPASTVVVNGAQVDWQPVR